MLLAVPVSMPQFWAFIALALVFFAFLIRTASRRDKGSGVRTNRRSRLGIILQSLGIGLAGFGRARPTLEPLSPAGLLGTAVVLFMGIAIVLFAASSSALGRNWSVVARTRSDHELVRSGPYAYVRHPIYLGMLFFLLGLATALGHWFQLIIAVPVFLAGTASRTRVEEGLLERSFGDKFREYRNSTPALIPKLL
jgi:protein-S-isoprenylcysteine O-methyltransferase Ste14